MKKQITTIMFLLAFSFNSKMMSAWNPHAAAPAHPAVPNFGPAAAAGMIAHHAPAARIAILPQIAANCWIGAVGGRQNCRPAFIDDASATSEEPAHLALARVREQRAYAAAFYLDTLEELKKSQYYRLQLTQEITRLQTQLQTERAAAQGALHTYDAEKRTLTAKIQHTEAEIAQLKADIAQLRIDMDGLRGDRDGAKRDLIETRADRDALKKERDDLRVELAAKNAELELIKRSLSIHESLNPALEAHISELEAEVATRKATITGIVGRMRHAIGQQRLYPHAAAWLFTGDETGALPLV